MKKYLLMAVALMTSVAMFADTGWQEDRRFTPVTAYSELSSIHTTVAADGSVYASSSITTEMSFAGKTLTPTAEGSTCVVKYDKDGNEIWAILFSGSNALRAMTVDADGNLYVAGTVTGEKTEFIGTDGISLTVINPTKYDEMWGETVVSGKAAYIVKITADGVITAAHQENPAGPDANYFGDARIIPNKIAVDNGKVYVSCFYNGAVEALGWEGRYVTMLDFDTFETMYFGDITGAGIFSVSSSDLTGPTNVANLKATTDADMLDDNAIQCAPDAFSFVATGGMVGAAFIGWGKLTLSTPTQSRDFSFDMKGEGLNEHALVLAMTSNIENMSLVYHAEAQDNSLPEYNLFGEMAGMNVILSGTFSGQFPLDNTKYSKGAGEENKYKNASFLASISPMTSTVKYSWVNDAEEESYTNGMIVTGEETHVGTETAVYHFNTSEGTAKGSEPIGVLDAAQINDTYAAVVYTEQDKTDVRVWAIPMNEPSAVEAVEAAGTQAAAKYYTIDGMEIAAPQKGISIVKTADGVKKIAK